MRIQASGVFRSCGRVRRYQWSNTRKWLIFREASVARGQHDGPVFNIVDVPADQSLVQRADLQAGPAGIGKSNPGENWQGSRPVARPAEPLPLTCGE